MNVTRRQFVRGGVTAFTFGSAAPQFLTELALAQSGGSRNLVVLYLNGGNDALSTLVPYGDPDYYARRPTIGIPAGMALTPGNLAIRRVQSYPALAQLPWYQQEKKARPGDDRTGACSRQRRPEASSSAALLELPLIDQSPAVRHRADGR
mgnify:CR=1 FL=1